MINHSWHEVGLKIAVPYIANENKLLIPYRVRLYYLPHYVHYLPTDRPVYR